MYSFYENNKRFAVIGVSRKANSFSRKAYDFLMEQGCELYPINPELDNIGGRQCYRSLEEAPDVDAAIFFTNPQVTQELLQSCREKGIKEALFQFGAANKEIIASAREQGINGKQSCVFLHHPNSGFPHNIHRFIHRLVAKP